MPSKIEICNRALTTYLGAKRIVSLTENSKEASECNQHYDSELRGLLERFWWNFATGRVYLAETTNDRTTEWAYRYDKPSDSVAIRWVNDKDVARALKAQFMSPDCDRETTGDSIYCDVYQAVCEYTKLITDESVLPQSFANALSASLAAAIAMPITQNRALAKDASEWAMSLASTAVADDHRNTPPLQQELPEYLRDRGVT